MEACRKYATIGMVYDFLVRMHQKTGQDYSFPAAIAALDNEGQLLREPPSFPPFHSEMDLEEYVSFIRGLHIYADPVLPQAHTYMFDPTVEEVVLFPDNKDVFCILNMPHAITLPHTHNFFEITYVLKGSCTFPLDYRKRHEMQR